MAENIAEEIDYPEGMEDEAGGEATPLVNRDASGKITSAASLRDNPFTGDLYISYMATHPEMVGQGLGKAMLDRIMKMAAERDAGLSLEATPHSLPFWKKMGAKQLPEGFLGWTPEEVKARAGGETTLYRGTKPGGNKAFAATFYAETPEIAKEYGDVTEKKVDLSKHNLLNIDDPATKKIVEEYTGENLSDPDDLNEVATDNFAFPDKPWTDFLKSKGYTGTKIGKEIALFDEAKPAAKAEPEIRTGYRGTPEGGGSFGATEGHGIYIADSPELARFFGETKPFKYRAPKNPLVVDEEPLHLLQETDELMQPIHSDDSEWTKLNKQAREEAGVTDANWNNESQEKIEKKLTELMKAKGYDAVEVKSGGEKWTVLLDTKLADVEAKPAEKIEHPKAPVDIRELKYPEADKDAKTGEPITIHAYRASMDPEFRTNEARGTFFAPEATPEFGNHIYRAKLEFKNPLVVDDGVAAAKQLGDKALAKKYEDVLSGWDSETDAPLTGTADAYEVLDKQLMALAKKAGHDGIVFHGHDDLNPVQYIAVDQKAITNAEKVGQYSWSSLKVEPEEEETTGADRGHQELQAITKNAGYSIPTREIFPNDVGLKPMDIHEAVKKAYPDSKSRYGMDHQTEKEVALNKLQGIQKTIESQAVYDNLNKLKRGDLTTDLTDEEGENGALVVRVDGKDYVVDGNHRLAALKLAGEKTAKVHFVDTDEAVKPVARGAEDARQEVAIKDYTSNAYFSINEKLRQGKGDELSARQKEVVGHLDKAIASNTLPDESTVYRAVSGKRAGDKYLKEGAVVQDNAFLSTSRSEGGAKNAMKDTMGDRGAVTMVEITAPAGTNAHEVGHAYNPMGISLRPSEGEVIFGRGTRVEITKVDEESRKAWGKIITEKEGPAGGKFSGKASDFVDKDYLPPEADEDAMYHVTTAKDKVLAEGLKSRKETKTAGLGGGYNNQAADRVSVTFDEGHANQIAERMRLAVDAAKDKVTPQEVLDRMISDAMLPDDEPGDIGTVLGAPAEVLDDWDAFNDWLNEEYPKGDSYRLLQDLDDGIPKIYTEAENPVRVGFTASKEAMAKIDPDQIQILKVEGRAGAKPQHIPDEAELRFKPEDLRVAESEKPAEDAGMKRLVEKLNAKDWFHVPPEQGEAAYAHRGKFMTSQYANAELYGKPDIEAHHIEIKNPIVGTENEIAEKLGVSPQYSNMPYSEVNKLDREWAVAAKKAGYDAIVTVPRAALDKFMAGGRIPRNMEVQDLTHLDESLPTPKAQAHPDPIGIHEDDLPYRAKYASVDFDKPDMQDSGKRVTAESIKKDYVREKDRNKVSVYQSYIPMEDLPTPKFVSEEEENFDRQEYRPRIGSPIKVDIHPNGSVNILDGNHRVQVWGEQNQEYAPAWVIDHRHPGIEMLSEDEKAEREEED